MASSLGSLHSLVWTALASALVAAGAFLVLPLGPVPFSLQPLFVLLAGAILGPARGAAAVALYLAAGAVGLPVFAGGRASLGHLLGPTGGYLLGFLPCAALAGMAARGGKPFTTIRGLAWGGLGLAALYAIGALWLRSRMDLDWTRTLAMGVAPFLPWDLLKLLLAVLCRRRLGQLGLLPS